jgi:hypothetical protein
MPVNEGERLCEQRNLQIVILDVNDPHRIPASIIPLYISADTSFCIERCLSENPLDKFWTN